ncbi:unnamed protein product [Paramecium octaurelia]|uniref:Uncharacterized protein n=1 Tax=Paramecium octaurelia TaxID=43137 RepID=A0A8S1YC15_PAROT|nr:unnamed protein product [Paramecium octaurelia]
MITYEELNKHKREISLQGNNIENVILLKINCIDQKETKNIGSYLKKQLYIVFYNDNDGTKMGRMMNGIK